MSGCDSICAATAPPHVRAIAPYQPGKPISELARELGLAEADIVKLASNENPLGPSPFALAAAQDALLDMALYPDGAGYALKAKLSARLGVDAAQIVLGNGSNDVLDMVARAYLAPGTSAVYAQYAFAVYPIATHTVGAHGIAVAARDFGHDLERMRAAIRDDTRVVWIANPNNPTGTFLPWNEIEAFLETVPPRVLVVLDEAYGEYLAPASRCDTAAWVVRFPNLLISRTFSKAYGLAGLRVGYGIGHADVVDLLNRVRHPFNVNASALAAAEAALDDDAFLARSYALNAAGMQQLLGGLAALDIETVPSKGNFVLARVGDAARINTELLKRGVIVRPVAAYGLPEFLRVSVGLAGQNARFLDALGEVLAAAPGRHPDSRKALP
ncbi:histidinol-phosphate aminotransferase [Thiobacillus denitrificans ATCC 25259]|uniref:Histidinol-phosphate aminotransferase 1 n=1 Tax=Thiobacillus denitrificans (strain ATCC 25259 / T1) TaxID=292415 RepID=HIS81_THIDA|nr:histidinol-phosphate transaminase [Thiobacillus denitrificans]Q3SK85.1 RecName: Full=Histidinol-phosphate aminotransferase 1; AltName: Full=Imidazole acetol-phosphate transaminase 1 [Thiobacillus denitrificans ATCC 25259]AAZ96905.1 histidinol-phosphate aminotransferase [Thiobacillus denitrificans ATCC 25259]